MNLRRGCDSPRWAGAPRADLPAAVRLTDREDFDLDYDSEDEFEALADFAIDAALAGGSPALVVAGGSRP